MGPLPMPNETHLAHALCNYSFCELESERCGCAMVRSDCISALFSLWYLYSFCPSFFDVREPWGVFVCMW